MGRFSPTEPAGLLARSYYELLENKKPILGKNLNNGIFKNGLKFLKSLEVF